MTIAVPFQLLRNPTSEPATALFLSSGDPGQLFSLCERLEIDPTNRVFEVGGGFLLELASPSERPAPGAVRLRAIHHHFYIPVDARLSMPLLEDEMAGLVRDGGIVLLPGDRALRYDLESAVDWARLLALPQNIDRNWLKLPEPRHLFNRVRRIDWKPPEPASDEFYHEIEDREQDRDREVGQERSAPTDPTNDSTEFDETDQGFDASEQDRESDRRSAEAPASAHTFLHSIRQWLGRTNERVASARDKSASVFRGRSALIKKLIAEFREGDAARALEHAISMEPPDARGLSSKTRSIRFSGHLPRKPAIYSLAELLHRHARGRWVLRWDVEPILVKQLADEYRKYAERAQRDGDFRRAAYIHGKLLHDHRGAAHALMRGGLYRDAAMLYLHKVDEPESAALAFEAAGDVDRAVAIYRRLGRHEKAGDLLLRIGERDAAVAEYIAAASDLSEKRGSPLHAGRLLAAKAARPDLALPYFEEGWKRRPGAGAIASALGIVRVYCGRSEIAPVRRLLEEASAFLEQPQGEAEAGTFHKGILEEIDAVPAMAAFGDEVRDRLLQDIGRGLRRQVERGQPAASAVSSLLAGGHWSASVMSDANFALTQASRRRGEPRHERDSRLPSIQVGKGLVTAVCHAWKSGELFVGSEDGQVHCYCPNRNEVSSLGRVAGPVTDLKADASGRIVVALSEANQGTTVTTWIKQPDGSYQARPTDHVPSISDCWLSTIEPVGGFKVVGLGYKKELVIVQAATGLHHRHFGLHAPGMDYAPELVDQQDSLPTNAILIPMTLGPEGALGVLTHDGPNWFFGGEYHSDEHSTACSWLPGIPPGFELRRPVVISRFSQPYLDLLGLDQSGAVCTTQFELDASAGRMRINFARVGTTQDGYIAANYGGGGRIVAVSPTGIDWLRLSGNRFRALRHQQIRIPSAIACFTWANEDAFVLCSDGSLVRVARPPFARRESGFWKRKE